MTAALHDNGLIHGFEGRTLGGFRMAREIACGGMATVYLAHKAGTMGIGQPAAVKIIHPHLSRDHDFVDMFLDEARIVSCIGHPNVCRVLDFGKAEGTYYLAMEFVMGETWADVLTKMKATREAQTMIPAVLAQILAQSCEGLHAAHEARDPQGTMLQIVHRDISPQNIIVGYDGSVRVLDFGIASAAEKLHTTRNGTIKGRFAYMAPEQMRGHVVDRRADIWSLGVVLWEGLAQHRLFKRETEAETVLAVTHDPLPTLQNVGQAVPAALARVAAHALNRDRDKRYTTAREMGLELSRYASSALVPMGMPEVSNWMQRLFAEQIEQKRSLLRDAANAADASVRKSLPVPPLFTADPQSMEIEHEVRAADTVASPSSGLNGVPSISTVREVPRTEPNKLRAVAAVAIALTLAMALVFQGGDEAIKPVPESDRAQSAAPAAETRPATLAAVPAHNEPLVPERQVGAKPEPSRAPGLAPRAAPVTRNADARKRAPESIVLGTVSIATPGGWAEVYLGNKKLGTTPARYELPVGTHTLRIRPFGKLPEITRRVDVTANGAAKLKLALD